MTASTDPRLEAPRWSASPSASAIRRVRLLVAVDALLALWYVGWLLTPSRVGNPVLFAVLVVAEVFNLTQAAGFWWTASRQRTRVRPPPAVASRVRVDVLVPVYDEPVDVVEPTIAAATRLRGADVHVALLDDGARREMESLAARYGVTYLRRGVNTGAKAGNLNHALARTDAPYVLVLDCDHVPDPSFLTRTLGHFDDPGIAFVQTPQYYANRATNDVAGAAWAQQALFFGAIGRGKDRLGAMFCCGTNVVFRRAALAAAGGFPEDSVTEDFELSVRLHELGWRSAYVPEVLAAGLGPEDMASYVSQQHRWARGCLSSLRRICRSRLPWRLRAQYLLSAAYFLTGWTVLVYMTLPVVRILTGAQPLAGASADQFLLHFAPYFGMSLLTVAVAGAGAYTFRAFALAAASFWIHCHASLAVATGRRGRFVVTPKRGARRRQPRAVVPALVAVGVLAGAATIGLTRSQGPATLNNVAFALLHVSVLGAGIAPALRRPARTVDVAEDAEGRVAA